MLESVKIQRRQSEIRQQLAELVGKPEPSEDETRQMESLDSEYRTNETRLRAALIAEDEERREAGRDLETREGSEWSDLIGKFELRQAVSVFAEEGRALEGATAEVVGEMRSRGSYRGVPIPLEALEQRAGETIASGTPDPTRTMPIIDRLFAGSAFTRIGGQVIGIDAGQIEWPVVTSRVSAGWADGETASVAGPSVFATTDRALAPDQTLGITMKVTRKALKQSGGALEQAIRRDMQNAIRVELDRAAFLGSGATGEPLGLIAGAGTYGITSTAVDATADYAAFRGALVRFMLANAVTSPADVRLVARPETWDVLESQAAATAAPLWEMDRLIAAVGAGNVTLTSNALAAPSGSPAAATALLATSAGGVAPAFMGLWGGVDLVRDPYSGAASGGLRLTGLLTTDITVARPAQVEILTGLQAAT